VTTRRELRRRRLAARRRFRLAVAALTVVALAVRLASVLGSTHLSPLGDAFYYHSAADLLVAGHGFVDPWYWYGQHRVVQTASWPPLFVAVLATAAAVGAKSFLAQRVWCCLVGAALVPLVACTGRRMAGARVGLVAGALAALYPNLWLSDDLGLSETLSPLLVAGVLLLAYRFWQRPGPRRALALGAAVGVAALGRDEMALYVPLVLVPLALLARLGWRRRLVLAGLGTLAALVTVAPWVGYNMHRFRDPTFISSGLGITLASANCDRTYRGPLEGYWSVDCALDVRVDPHADQSVQGAQYQTEALHYVRAHAGRLPAVALARLGRAFGAFHPMEQVALDATLESRPRRWALVGLVSYYALAATTLVGLVVLRRRRVPVLPLLGVGVAVALTVVVTFGQTRYRTPLEVVLVLGAAVALGAPRRRARHRHDLGGTSGASGEGGAELAAALAVLDAARPAAPDTTGGPRPAPVLVGAGARALDSAPRAEAASGATVLVR